jgi:hypothetical protein
LKGAFLALWAVPAAACPNCAGTLAGTGLGEGIWWGIVILLAVTMSLVGGFAYTFWRVEQARARAERGLA